MMQPALLASLSNALVRVLMALIADLDESAARKRLTPDDARIAGNGWRCCLLGNNLSRTDCQVVVERFLNWGTKSSGGNRKSSSLGFGKVVYGQDCLCSRQRITVKASNET